MDEILWSKEDSTRRTNNPWFRVGMTNGQLIVVRGVMKPIPTLQATYECGYRNPRTLQGNC